MNLSIVIVNYRSMEALSRCLDSIISSKKPDEYEIIVVNNDTHAVDWKKISGKSAVVRVIHSPRNMGFSGASNLGMEKASGKYILLLNPDTVVREDAIWKLYQFLEENPEYGAVGPKIVFPDGRVQLECGRDFPSIAYVFYEFFLLRRVFPRGFGGLRLENWDHNTSRDVPCLLGAAILFPKELLRNIGLLDTELPLYLEDMDFCWRIEKSGKKNHCLTDAVVVHEAGHSSVGAISSERLNLYVMELCQANYLFFKKHKNFFYAEAYRLLVAVGAVFRIILILPGILFFKALKKYSKEFSWATLQKYAAFFKWSLSPRVRKLAGETS